jgi:hypothetical protein
MQEVDASEVLEQPKTLMISSLAEFDSMVEDRLALTRLWNNPDFQRIIVKRYLNDDFTRLSELLKSRNRKVVQDRDLILAKIVSKGHLEHWLEDMDTTLFGIEDPAQRLELIRQLEEAEVERTDAMMEGSDEA